MNFLSIIAERRDGGQHSEAAIRVLVRAVTEGTVPDYQISAWLMAAFLNPLDEQETVWLTQAMAESGDRVDLTGLPKPWVDKHSTGGVGDKTTLVLLPLLAACGLTLVKMSGRGLGITGGTVDKLSSIPGFRIDLSPSELKETAKECGLALTGQTPDLAPADKVLYALRDATGTTASIPLIASSILSKKIAGGAETVVLDVKCGSGAFMKDLAQARELAGWLKRIGEKSSLRMRCALSDMNQPLGAAMGNALEIREAWDVLSGASLSAPVMRFRDLCLDLAGETLEAVGLGDRATAQAALASGAAAAKFQAWMTAQGAPGAAPDSLPHAAFQTEMRATQDGWVSGIDAEKVGQVVLDLGGGRKTKEDTIDPTVGLVLNVLVGSQVKAGQPLIQIHAANEASATAVTEALHRAFTFSNEPVEAKPALIELL